MKLSDLIYETWSALTANKGRSLLTILGIVIGIASVIAMTSLIDGIKNSLVSELGLDQSRVVNIDYYNGTDKKAEDIQAIAEGVSGYEFVTGYQMGSSKVNTGTKQADASIMGVNPGYFRAMGSKLTEGRLLTDQELAGDEMSVVVDMAFVRNLFGENESAVGKDVEIGNDSYRIVGVIEQSGMFGGQGSAFMPMQTCSIRITGSNDYAFIIGYAKEDVDMDSLTNRTESFIRERFQITEESEDGGWGYVYVQSIQSIQQELDSTMMSFQMMMMAVASISLLVGGIGIMNMMLTNVTERIREIGLRKALGAHRFDITAQFLMESVAICLVGGVIGFLVGYAGAWALAGLASGFAGLGMSPTSTPVAPHVSFDTVLFAIGICAGIGIVFGFWPAHRAAKLDPVESLRHQ